MLSSCQSRLVIQLPSAVQQATRWTSRFRVGSWSFCKTVGTLFISIHHPSRRGSSFRGVAPFPPLCGVLSHKSQLHAMKIYPNLALRFSSFMRVFIHSRTTLIFLPFFLKSNCEMNLAAPTKTTISCPKSEVFCCFWLWGR